MQVVAELMAIAARTAPKAGGKDYLEIKVLSGSQLAELARAMVDYGQKTGRKNYDRDGDNVGRSSGVLLIGLKGARETGMDCGACGYPTCKELPPLQPGGEFQGPICAWRLIDLGIALGSAAKTASILNADNRIMYRIGVLAREMGLMEGELVVGIPLSATGKNIYFDR
ncbi:MAG TPA: hypothetical protein GX711_07300 [Clostridia bacterium]|nr:hypothetical protein [Clostridia bacterium]